MYLSRTYKKQVSMQRFFALRWVRALRMWNIYNEGKSLYKDRSRLAEFLLHLEHKQQTMPNNVET